jgi:hypothetical protein
MIFAFRVKWARDLGSRLWGYDTCRLNLSGCSLAELKVYVDDINYQRDYDAGVSSPGDIKSFTS